MVFSNNLLMGAAGQSSGYEIEQSIRFNKSASASMSRTFGTPTDRNKFTYAFWMKACSESNGYCLETNVSGTSGTSFSGMVFNGGSMQFFDYTGGSANIDVRTTFTSASGKFRDYTGWYHAMFVFDSDESTDSDRLKFFVNGRQFPAGSLVGPGGGSVEWPTSGENSRFNASGTVHRISSSVNGLVDGYMADIYFIDGQALTPTSFGEFSSINGEFVPIKYSGTFGNNGFYIDGRDSSDLGDDESGNGNDFSTSNMGTDDQVTDAPTNNFCVWNSLTPATGTAGHSFSDGNLFVDITGFDCVVNSTFTFDVTDSGGWYAEVTIGTGSYNAGNWLVGLNNSPNSRVTGSNVQNDTNFFFFLGNGSKKNGSGETTGVGAALSAGDTVMLLFKDGEFYAGKAGTGWADGSGGYSDSSPTTALFSSITGQCTLIACNTTGDDAEFRLNAGQLSFVDTIPTGAKTLSATNLPDPAITDPKRYFGTLLYTGNGTTGQTVTGLETTSGTSWTPDLVWIKPRSQPYNHKLFDSVRTLGFSLESSTANAQADLSAEFIAFADGGFQVDDNGSNNINQSGVTHVAWNWEAGGGGSSNSDGSITSTVSVNTTAGFSIVQYEGTKSNATIGHGLGAVPKFIIIKDFDATESWIVGHSSLGFTKNLFLNLTNAEQSSATIFNNTAPTSSVFSIGTSDGVNKTDTHIAYCFAEVEGYSKFGGYTGNGNSNGNFVYLGFKPAFLFFKCTSAVDAWQIYDNKRRTFNGYGESIAPNSSAVEGSFTERADLLSNGFKIRSSNTAINGSGESYIFAAFAHSPFKTATAFGIEA